MHRFHALSILLLTILISCSQEADLQITDDGSAYTISKDQQPLLSYVHATTPAPEGRDPLYQRSAYIHPLYSPGGMRLTRIQPPDHYHHYGIWAPWTRTSFGPYKVDFWNLASAQGTVRFAEKLGAVTEADRAGLQLRKEHVYFLVDSLEEAHPALRHLPTAKGKENEGLAMEEFLEITVHGVEEKRYMVDVMSTFRTEMETGMTLEAYRYGGGIGFRATEMWGPGKASVLTSEGRTWEDADASHARWVIVEGESSVEEGRSGILFLSHPTNQAHPEPMRMWPPDANQGKENIFFEFCPIRHQEWKLEAWQDYTLVYRMVVFDGVLSADEAEAYWREFTASSEQ